MLVSIIIVWTCIYHQNPYCFLPSIPAPRLPSNLAISLLLQLVCLVLLPANVSYPAACKKAASLQPFSHWCAHPNPLFAASSYCLPSLCSLSPSTCVNLHPSRLLSFKLLPLVLVVSHTTFPPWPSLPYPHSLSAHCHRTWLLHPSAVEQTSLFAATDMLLASFFPHLLLSSSSVTPFLTCTQWQTKPLDFHFFCFHVLGLELIIPFDFFICMYIH